MLCVGQSRLPRLALAAAVAVVTAMPPAMGHAHEGGDRPHEHSPADHGSGGGDSAVGDSAIGAATGGPGSLGSGSSRRVSHVHFAWLGLRLTFAWPVSAPEDGSAEHVVVRLIDPVALGQGAADLPPPAVTWLPELGLLPLQAGSLPRPAAVRWALAAAPPAVLLCDTARHARSGVQLS